MALHLSYFGTRLPDQSPAHVCDLNLQRSEWVVSRTSSPWRTVVLPLVGQCFLLLPSVRRWSTKVISYGFSPNRPFVGETPSTKCCVEEVDVNPNKIHSLFQRLGNTSRCRSLIKFVSTHQGVRRVVPLYSPDPIFQLPLLNSNSQRA